MSKWAMRAILDIYVLRVFQWYKKRHKPLSLALKSLSEVLEVHRDSISQSGSCLGSVRVHSLTLSYIPKSMWCDFRASSWPATLQPLCLGRKLKARVATLSPTKRRGQCPHWHLDIIYSMQFFHLDPWRSNADFCGKTLPQANLGVPKFPSLSWQV